MNILTASEAASMLRDGTTLVACDFGDGARSKTIVTAVGNAFSRANISARRAQLQML